MSPNVVVLAGGVGGSRFVLGVRSAVRTRWPDAAVTVIANTGDDLWLTGVRLQPDVDSLLYALAGVKDLERGWGRAGDTSVVAGELAAWGAGWPWFTLGDLDLAAAVARAGWTREGVPVSEQVARLAARWELGVKLLPMTDAEVDTQVVTADGRMHFQEWWVRHRASVPALAFENPGIERARPAPGVLEAIAAADAVLLAPSNPVVSLGPILSVPGLAAAVAAAPGGVVGVSPVIGGAVVRGMADACLAALAVPTAADAVGLRYGPRARARATDRAVVRSVFRDPDATRRDSAFIPPSVPENGSTSGAYDRAGEAGLLDGWLIAEEDAALAPAIEAAGLPVRVLPLWMRDAPTSTALAAAAIETALEARAAPSPV